jgi:hypothetical protein
MIKTGKIACGSIAHTSTIKIAITNFEVYKCYYSICL